MPRRPTPSEKVLTDMLTARPLRRIEQLTTIGKNRLHRLRHFPLDARLHELLKLSNAGLIEISLSPAWRDKKSRKIRAR